MRKYLKRLLSLGISALIVSQSISGVLAEPTLESDVTPDVQIEQEISTPIPDTEENTEGKIVSDATPESTSEPISETQDNTLNTDISETSDSDIISDKILSTDTFYLGIRPESIISKNEIPDISITVKGPKGEDTKGISKDYYIPVYMGYMIPFEVGALQTGDSVSITYSSTDYTLELSNEPIILKSYNIVDYDEEGNELSKVVLLGSEDKPYSVDLYKVRNGKITIKVQDEQGNSLSGVKLRVMNYTNDSNLFISDDNGKISFDYDKYSSTPKVFSADKRYEVVHPEIEDDTSIWLDPYMDSAYFIVILKEVPQEEKLVTSSTNINVITSDTCLFNMELPVDIHNDENDISYDLNLGNNVLKLSSGTYTISSLSKELTFSDVPFEAGQEVVLNITPKYLLEVTSNSNTSNEFEVINESSLKGKSFTSNKKYGVLSGQTLMIKSNNKTYSVVINEGSYLTTLNLDTGAVSKSEVSNKVAPKTADYVTIIWIVVIASIILAGVLIYLFVRNKKLKNNANTRLMSMLLVASLIGSMSFTFTKEPTVYAGSHMGSGADNKISGSGGVKAGELTYSGTRMVKFSLVTGSDYIKLNEDTLAIDDLATEYKFNSYYNDTALFITSEDNFASAQNGGVWGIESNYKSGSLLCWFGHNPISENVVAEEAYRNYRLIKNTGDACWGKLISSEDEYIKAFGQYIKGFFYDKGKDCFKANSSYSYNYGSDLNTYTINKLFAGEDNSQATKVVNGYLSYLSNNGLITAARYAQLSEALSAGNAVILVETMLGVSKNKSTEVIYYATVNDLIKILAKTKDNHKVSTNYETKFVFGPDNEDVTSVWGSNGSYRSLACGHGGTEGCKRGDYCEYIGHLGVSMANAIANHGVHTIGPTAQSLSDASLTGNRNPYGGWGYINLGKVEDIKKDPGIWATYKYKIVDENGVELEEREFSVDGYGKDNLSSNKLRNFDDYLTNAKPQFIVPDSIQYNGKTYIADTDKPVWGEVYITQESDGNNEKTHYLEVSDVSKFKVDDYYESVSEWLIGEKEGSDEYCKVSVGSSHRYSGVFDTLSFSLAEGKSNISLKLPYEVWAEGNPWRREEYLQEVNTIITNAFIDREFSSVVINNDFENKDILDCFATWDSSKFTTAKGNIKLFYVDELETKETVTDLYKKIVNDLCDANLLDESSKITAEDFFGGRTGVEDKIAENLTKEERKATFPNMIPTVYEEGTGWVSHPKDLENYRLGYFNELDNALRGDLHPEIFGNENNVGNVKVEFTVVYAEPEQEEVFGFEQVPQWRINKYWKSIVPMLSKNKLALATGTWKPSPDESTCKDSYFSGSPSIKSIDPDLEGFPFISHAKLTTSTVTPTHGKPSVSVREEGDLMAFKDLSIDNLTTAKWLVNNDAIYTDWFIRTNYTIYTEGGTGNEYKTRTLSLNSSNGSDKESGDPYVIPSNSKNGVLFKFYWKPSTRFSHYKTIKYHPSCSNHGWHCRCYFELEYLGGKPSQFESKTADYGLAIKYACYNHPGLSGKTVTLKSDSTDGFTSFTRKSDKDLSVYGEVPMMFTAKNKSNSIKFVTTDKKVTMTPVSYHTLKYDLTVDPTLSATSVATDERATGLLGNLNSSNAQVVHKGSGTSTSYNITGVSGSDVNTYPISVDNHNRGTLTATTYAIDMQSNRSALKNQWNTGTDAYSALAVNNEFLNDISTETSGVRTAVLNTTEKLVIPSPGVNAEDAQLYGEDETDITLTANDTSVSEYLLTVRAGEITSIRKKGEDNAVLNWRDEFRDVEVTDGKGITHHEYITDALGNMVANRNGIFSVFASKAGDKLTEEEFATLASAVRENSNSIALNEGWYSEDTTVLSLYVYTTVFEIDPVVHSNKVPISLSKLNSPQNKDKFYSEGVNGDLQLEVSLQTDVDDCKSGFVYKTYAQRWAKGDKVYDLYAVPNVSIQDTTR